MAQKTHTEISPSNAERWMNCPGSVALCRKMPKPPQSAHAADGEAAHKLLEMCLKDKKVLPFDQIGNFIGEIEITEEMAEAVTFARDTILMELQKGGQLLSEQKVDIIEGMSGTLDAAIIRPYEKLTVYDFKYGKGVVVSAVDNPQMLLYALPLSKQHEVESVELVIIQPRTEGQISKWEASCDYLDTFAQEVERKISLTKEKDALVAAGSWCKWCWAKAICPTLRQDISDRLPAIPGKELILPDVKGLPIVTVAKILEYKDRIEAWMDAVFAYAQEYVEAGGVIPGWDLGKKRANRKWINEAKAIIAFADLGDKAFSEPKLLSPAQMEKVAGKDRVAPLTETPDNGTTLKRIGEKK